MNESILCIMDDKKMIEIEKRLNDYSKAFFVSKGVCGFEILLTGEIMLLGISGVAFNGYTLQYGDGRYTKTGYRVSKILNRDKCLKFFKEIKDVEEMIDFTRITYELLESEFEGDFLEDNQSKDKKDKLRNIFRTERDFLRVINGMCVQNGFKNFNPERNENRELMKKYFEKLPNDPFSKLNKTLGIIFRKDIKVACTMHKERGEIHFIFEGAKYLKDKDSIQKVLKLTKEETIDLLEKLVECRDNNVFKIAKTRITLIRSIFCAKRFESSALINYVTNVETPPQLIEAAKRKVLNISEKECRRYITLPNELKDRLNKNYREFMNIWIDVARNRDDILQGYINFIEYTDSKAVYNPFSVSINNIFPVLEVSNRFIMMKCNSYDYIYNAKVELNNRDIKLLRNTHKLFLALLETFNKYMEAKTIILDVIEKAGYNQLDRNSYHIDLENSICSICDIDIDLKIDNEKFQSYIKNDIAPKIIESIKQIIEEENRAHKEILSNFEYYIVLKTIKDFPFKSFEEIVGILNGYYSEYYNDFYNDRLQALENVDIEIIEAILDKLIDFEYLSGALSARLHIGSKGAKLMKDIESRNIELKKYKKEECSVDELLNDFKNINCMVNRNNILGIIKSQIENIGEENTLKLITFINQESNICTPFISYFKEVLSNMMTEKYKLILMLNLNTADDIAKDIFSHALNSI